MQSDLNDDPRRLGDRATGWWPYPGGGLLGLVGNTPLIRLARITAHINPAVTVFAKAEWFNPGGSVKDRPASGILQRAFESGTLGGNRVLLIWTSRSSLPWGGDPFFGGAWERWDPGSEAIVDGESH